MMDSHYPDAPRVAADVSVLDDEQYRKVREYAGARGDDSRAFVRMRFANGRLVNGHVFYRAFDTTDREGYPCSGPALSTVAHEIAHMRPVRFRCAGHGEVHCPEFERVAAVLLHAYKQPR